MNAPASSTTGAAWRALEAEGRARIYRFLAGAYLAPPGLELLVQLREPNFLDALSLLFDAGAVDDLRACADTEPSEGALAGLKQEYMDLFAVPGGRYVMPFEDVYRGRTVDGRQQRGPLLGERAVAVKRAYREAGAAIEQACRELPTHVGVELAFMDFLCEREAAAVPGEDDTAHLNGGNARTGTAGAYRALQHRFLENHLARWYPELGEAIGAKAKGAFYRGLARLTGAVLARDLAALAVEDAADKVA
jgi:TorA maturation chaperone TorD